MARLKKRTRPFYVAKITLNKLFSDGGYYFDDEDKKRIKRINMLKRLKKRCAKIYDKAYERVDSYYRENVKFLYRVSKSGETTELDFYSHQAEKERAKKETLVQRFGSFYGVRHQPDIVYTGKTKFNPNEEYLRLIEHMNVVNTYGNRRQHRIEKETKILNRCKLKKIFSK